ncbi:MAG TPA: flavodoxin family protein, partial [Erysipelotrichaceae bacterium]|nr:flavodoxin family protein [Erysipelotrichaceae bacterium]
GCIGCRKCATLGCCIFHDIVNEIAPKLMEADGVVIGSPVYFAGMNGTLVSFMDRLFYSTGDKRMKVGAAVVSSRRAGSVQTFNAINSYFTISQMPIASSRYWNEVHGYTKEDVMKDEEGVQTMRILGRNMAFLMKAIGLQKEREGLPVSEEPVHTHFIR